MGICISNYVVTKIGDRKSLSIAKNHLKPSQDLSEQFGPVIHKLKGFSENSPRKLHSNFAKNLGRQILENTFSGPRKKSIKGFLGVCKQEAREQRTGLSVLARPSCQSTSMASLETPWLARKQVLGLWSETRCFRKRGGVQKSMGHKVLSRQDLPPPLGRPKFRPWSEFSFSEGRKWGVRSVVVGFGVFGVPRFSVQRPQIPIFKEFWDLWTENRGAPKTPNSTTTDLTPHLRPSGLSQKLRPWSEFSFPGKYRVWRGLSFGLSFAWTMV